MDPNFENIGYKMLRYETFDADGGNDYHIVLMYNHKKGEWATWECKNENDFYWGHYFRSFLSAKIDYHKRLMEAYERRMIKG